MEEKIIALTGDYGYINPITATIKSILYNNSNCKIYIVNSDIPQEWFTLVNQQLRNSDSQIIDQKIIGSDLANEYVGLDHIKPIAYGKILLPDLLNEKRVLYLDSDLIVDGDLTDLYQTDLSDHPIAVAKDVDENNGHFNTGVILYNLEKLKSIPHLVADELKIGQNQGLRNADQDVMNAYFMDNYHELPLKDNFQIGMDSLSYYAGHQYYFDAINQVKDPLIIHYLTPDKPWKTVSHGRLREKWWQYFGLSWQDVLQHHPLPQLHPHYDHRFFTFIYTQNYGKLNQLIRALPNCQFNIGAWSEVGEPIIQLLHYPNVRVYPCIIGDQLNELTNHCDAYLDVNFDGKERKAIDPFEKQNKPILAFAEVADNPHQYANYHQFANDDVQGMINALKNL